MAHNCPECGGLCYCDLEDIDWGDESPDDCTHECEFDENEEDFCDDSYVHDSDMGAR